MIGSKVRQPNAGRERLATVPEDQLSEQQRALVSEIKATRGVFDGPFVALLRSPELLRRVGPVGDYFRQGTVLDQRVVRTAVLVVAEGLGQAFEWRANCRHALAAGVDQQTIDAIATGGLVVSDRSDEQLAHDVARALLKTTTLDDQLYQRAETAFGEDGLVELVGVVGYFALIAMVLNVAGTP